MKTKRYSESKIKTAQKYLSKYDVSFDDLNEPQKKVIVHYTNTKKLSWLAIAVFTIGLAVYVFAAYTYYNRMMAVINYSIEESTDTESIDLHKYGMLCAKRGFLLGISAFTAFYILLFILFFPFILRSKHQIFEAFLPLLNNPSDNENR